MKHKRTFVDYLLDILDNAEKAERFVAGITREESEANDTYASKKTHNQPVGLFA